MKRTFAFLLLFLMCAPLGVAGETVKLSKYNVLEIEIENTRNEKGQKLPDESVGPLRESLIHAIGYQHLFRVVANNTDEAVAALKEEHPLVLRVKITGYSGAQNNASISSELTFTDKLSGNRILQKPVRAKLWYDSGSTSGSMSKLARSIADVIKDNW